MIAVFGLDTARTWIQRSIRLCSVCLTCMSVAIVPAHCAYGAEFGDRDRVSVTPHVLTIGDTDPRVYWLHERLAELGYLPFTFHDLVPTDRLYRAGWGSPDIGGFTWKYANVPDTLRELWDPCRYNELTRGAVMTFEIDHGLRPDGFAGPAVFRAIALSSTCVIGTFRPYRYVYVKQSIPQTVRVWENGSWIFAAPCSTGVDAAPTHVGTHVIYLRNREQSMKGVGPSGKPYHVDHVPYVSFFYQGEALHGLPRSRYGIPQSAGCVELAIHDAKRLWELTDYGTLVTVGDPQEQH
ncbi:ErfK/YbiS/YcfS/YnhG family protein [Alicyclobacillus tengchongensis]|nr:ErfK/YbiS/YcfS/YnhG family protein [Alicyclobacillus tengchongensis]